MNRSPKKNRRVRTRRPKPLNAKPGRKRLLAKAVPDAAQVVSHGLPDKSHRAPATPLMVTPIQAWHTLCARTGGGVNLHSFYRWIEQGRVYSVRMGRRIFVPIEALDDLIKRCLMGERL